MKTSRIPELLAIIGYILDIYWLYIGHTGAIVCISSSSRMLFSGGVGEVVGFLVWRARMGKDVNWEPEPTLQWLAVSKERFPAWGCS